MTHLRRNTIPAPPQDTTSRHFKTWVERTFPPGSTFRIGAAGAATGGLLCIVDRIETHGAFRGGHIADGHLSYHFAPGLRDAYGGLLGQKVDALVGPGKMPSIPFAKIHRDYLNGDMRPMVDHWAPFQGSAPSVKHRRLAPNTIPTPPMSTYPAAGSTLLAPAAYGQWVERTYRAGTRVTFPNGIVTLLGPLPPGARGVVERVQTEWGTLNRAIGRATYAPEFQLVYVRVTDARDRSGLTLSKFANHVMQIDSLYYYAAGENMTQAVYPLDDNWGAAAPTKRTSLPTSQRGVSMKHRRLAPNMVQPPHDPTTPELLSWAKVTYAPGTLVKFEGGGVAWWVGDRLRTHDVLVPDGTRGTVVRVDAPTADNGRPEGVVVTVKVHDARSYAYAADAPPGETRAWIEADIHDMWKKLDAFGTGHVTRGLGTHALRMLVPLDDNWGSSKSYRQIAPHRVTTGIKRTSRPRRVSPNKYTSKRRTSRKKGKMGR